MSSDAEHLKLPADHPSVTIDAATATRLEQLMREILERLPPRRVSRLKSRRKPQTCRPRPLTIAQLASIEAIRRHAGNRTAAALELGISRQSLNERYDAALVKLSAIDPQITRGGRHCVDVKKRRAIDDDNPSSADAA